MPRSIARLPHAREPPARRVSTKARSPGGPGMDQCSLKCKRKVVSSESHKLENGARVSTRYVVGEELAGGGGRAYVGTDTQRAESVLLIAISAEEAAALKHLVGVVHRHLA